MSDSNKLAFAGDVKIEKLEITSIASGNTINILNQVIGIQIFEDLFSPFISGNLIIRESIDVLNNLPLTGQEWVDIKIKTPSFEDEDDIEGRFFVYKISDREYLAEKNVMYKLHFMSEHALKEATMILSKGYKGKVSDMVKQHLIDWVGEGAIGDIEETKNNNRYISNFWTPVKNINFLCNNAINVNDSPSFIFYQSRKGFNFVSLEKLYKSDTKQTFSHNLKGREIGPTGQSTRDLEYEFQRISDITLPESFDNVYKMSTGAFASKLHSYDIVTKEWKIDRFQYRDKFKEKTHLNEYPLTPKKMEEYFKPEACILTDYRQYGVFNEYGDVSNYRIMQDRISMLVQSEGLSVRIVVPGRTDYTVGQKVELKVMQPEPVAKDKDEIEEELDNTFSGKYIVAAINHSITRERHECTMELIKDSWLKNVDNFDENE